MARISAIAAVILLLTACAGETGNRACYETKRMGQSGRALVAVPCSEPASLSTSTIELWQVVEQVETV